MSNVFMILSSGDKEVHNEISFMYAPNALKFGWMDKVRVILWGPTERLAASDEEFRSKVNELLEAGVEVYACKKCSDNYGVSEKIAELGVTVMYVGKMVSDMLKDGWHQLNF